MMARMLGMVLTSEPTAAADFELVTRLEKLILANQADITSTLPVDNAFSDLAARFRDRLADAPSRRRQRDDDDDDDDDVPDSSRSNEGHRTRSRSLSPMRTRDPNIY